MTRTAIVSTIAEKLKQASTQQDKQGILSYYEKESLFKRILSYTHNPLIQFGLSDWQPKSLTGKLHGLGISKFMHIPEDIFQNKFTKDEAVFACNLAINHMNSEEVEMFVGMIRKDLDLGLEPSTINAVWPGLVPDYPLQTATEFHADTFATFGTPFAVQKMSSGLRVNIVVRGNVVEFRQSNGEFIRHWDQYTTQFSTLAQNGANTFDGHAVVVDEQSCIISTDDQVVLSAPADSIRFIIWDVVRYDGFVQGQDQRIGYNWRFNGLEHMMFLAVDKNPLPCYRVPEHTVCDNLQQVQQFASGDTVVLKNLAGTWAAGASTNELIYRPSA